MRLARDLFTVACLLTALVMPACAAETALPANALGLAWGAPFIGLLLSIALFPVIAPGFWHRHYGKAALFWALAFLIPAAIIYGLNVAAHVALHVFLVEFIPFIIILIALFTIAGGIHIEGDLHGSPLTNTLFLGAGSLLASIIGTTGASMVLIRPLIRANIARRGNAHVIVFFIFLVSNIGGSLTALGDPPLFLGYLKGVPFFWPAQQLLLPALFCICVLLLVFFLLDSWLFKQESEQHKRKPRDETPNTGSLKLHGTVNLALLLGIIFVILFTSKLRLGGIALFGAMLQTSDLLRDVALLALAGFSLLLTPKSIRIKNDFSWMPAREVALIFIAIFLTAAPVLAMLQLGREGPLAFLTALVSNPDGTAHNPSFFWLTGALSAFLDNAPTYLVFFELAGGDAQTLAGPMATTLAAISCGAVFMGALTYIGNAPNFMVRAIAENQGVRMPSFFGYLAWSGLVLLPVFAAVTLLFFN